MLLSHTNVMSSRKWPSKLAIETRAAKERVVLSAAAATVDVIVTDAGAPEQLVAGLRGREVQVVVAG